MEPGPHEGKKFKEAFGEDYLIGEKDIRFGKEMEQLFDDTTN